MFGEILSAGANFVGGLMNRQETRRANEQNAAIARENIALQKQFAQEGIRWKVEDAKAAGIHPLYALGATTHSFSPVSAGAVADSSLGNAMAAAGQDLGRAINATRTSSERQTAFDTTVQKLTLQKMGLENDLLASQIAKMRAAPNPAMPALSTNPLGAAGAVIPQADKWEERPNLMLGRKRIPTDPYTSNFDDFSKRYGDEGLPQWVIAPQIMFHDYMAANGAPIRIKDAPNYGAKPWWDRWVPRFNYYPRHTFKERWQGERR